MRKKIIAPALAAAILSAIAEAADWIPSEFRDDAVAATRAEADAVEAKTRAEQQTKRSQRLLDFPDADLRRSGAGQREGQADVCGGAHRGPRERAEYRRECHHRPRLPDRSSWGPCA